MPCFYVRYTDARKRVNDEPHTGRTYEAGHMLFHDALDAYLYGKYILVHADVIITACQEPSCVARQAEELYGPTQPLPLTEAQLSGYRR